MKSLKLKWISLMVTLFLALGTVFSAAIARQAKADDPITPEHEVTVGVFGDQYVQAGRNYTLTVSAMANRNFSSYQLRLYLPEFISVIGIESKLYGQNYVFDYNLEQYGASVTYSSVSHNSETVDLFDIEFAVSASANGKSGNIGISDSIFTDIYGSSLLVGTQGANIYVKGEATRIKGDFDNNGVVNIKDVMYMQRYIVGRYERPVSEADIDAADIDGNKVINIIDCQYIQSYLVGLIPSLDNIGGGDDPHGGDDPQVPTEFFGEYTGEDADGVIIHITLNADRTFDKVTSEGDTISGYYINKGNAVYLVSDYVFVSLIVDVQNKTLELGDGWIFSGLEATATGYADTYYVNGSDEDTVTVAENGAFYRTCIEDYHTVQYNGMIGINGIDEEGIVSGTAYVFGTNAEDCLMSIDFTLDKKSNKIYVEQDHEILYTAFYYGMELTFFSDNKVTFYYGTEMESSWFFAKGYVVMVVGDGELMGFNINEDGRTLTPTEFSPEDFVFRVVIKNKNSETVATYPITFDKTGKSVTPITLTDSAYIVIEKSFEGEIFYKETSYSSMLDAGDYEVNYSVEFHEGGGYSSNFSVANMKEYSADYIGTLILEDDGKFYRVEYREGKEKELIEMEFSVENGIYAFDCSYESRGIMYYTLENRKFTAYVPNTAALYTYNRDRMTIKLYGGGYAVYNEMDLLSTTHYELQTNENGETIVILPRCIMGGVSWLRNDRGELEDGWQEGDVQVEASVVSITTWGNNRFIVGKASLQDVTLNVRYSDGSEQYITAAQVQFDEGVVIDFNKPGRYNVYGTYQYYRCYVWFEIGYADDVYSRYLSGDTNVVWLIDENGNVVADYSIFVMYENTFGGTNNSIQLTERDFNAADIASIMRGKSQDVYTLRTLYTYPSEPDKYISVRIALLSVADMSEKFTKIEVQDRGPLVYVIDEQRFIPTLYTSYVQVDFMFEITENDKTYNQTFYYKKPITQEDIVNTESVPFMTEKGNYRLPIVIAIDSEHSYEVSIMSINSSDIVQMVMFYTNKGPYTLPNAYVGEDTGAYVKRLMNELENNEVRFMAYWVANLDTPISGEEYYPVPESIFDFSNFDTSAEGVQNVHYVTTDIHGERYVADIAINVVAG